MSANENMCEFCRFTIARGTGLVVFVPDGSYMMEYDEHTFHRDCLEGGFESRGPIDIIELFDFATQEI